MEITSVLPLAQSLSKIYNNHTKNGNRMKKRSTPLDRLGSIIYTLAALLGMCLTMVSVVPDLESVFYGFKSYGGKPLASPAI